MARQRKINKNGDVTSSKPHKIHPRTAKKSESRNSTFLMIVAFLTTVVITTCLIYFWNKYYLEARVSTPIDVPKVVVRRGLDIPERYWGSYRSGLYFGLKTRHPKSLVVGLMWFAQRLVNHHLQIRHWCNQGDALKRYGWLQHDGTNFGVQEIVDEEYTLTTSFVKRLGGSYGGDWTAKIAIDPKVKNDSMVPVSLLFYTATDGDGTIQPIVDEDGRLKQIKGSTEGLGNFDMYFLPAQTDDIVHYNFLHIRAAPGLEFLKEVVMHNMVLLQARTRHQILSLAGHALKGSEQQGNYIVHQVTGVPPFEIEIIFESASFPGRSTRLQGDIYDSMLRKYQNNFDTKFAKTFQLSTKDFDRGAIKSSSSLYSVSSGAF